MRICILEHEPESPAGYLSDWAQERRHRARVVSVPRLDRWPALDEQDLIVSLGSDRSVHASHEPWIADEIAFVRAAHDASVPVLGICFGGQLLAAALGGSVRRARAPRADWQTVPTSDPVLIPPGPWFRWHEDMFEPPPGARLLAGSANDPLAFVLGSSVGLQFHPEVGLDLAHAWIAGGREQMARQGIDATVLASDARDAAPGARQRAFSLFDRLMQVWDGAQAALNNRPDRQQRRGSFGRPT